MNMTSLLSLVQGKEQKRQLRGILRDRTTASWCVACDLLEDCGKDAQANRLRAVLDLMDAFQKHLTEYPVGTGVARIEYPGHLQINVWGGPVELRLGVVHGNHGFSPFGRRTIIPQSNFSRWRLGDSGLYWKKHMRNAERVLIFLDCEKEASTLEGPRINRRDLLEGLLIERRFYEV